MADDDEYYPKIVREAISDSWRRSLGRGRDPTGGRLAPVVADERETHDRWAEHPLGGVAPLIHECLSAIADAAGYLIVVSDANGMLMTIEGSAQVRLRAAADMNFAEGTLWSEGGAGTNAIGTALAARPRRAGVRARALLRPGAALDLLGGADPRPGHRRGDRRDRPHRRPPSTVHPHSLAVATATARAVEASLQLALQEPRRAPARPLRVPRSPGPLRADDALGPGDRRRATGSGIAGRLAIPPGGGALVLPSGTPAVAEPVSPTLEAFVARGRVASASRSIAAPAASSSRFLGRDRAHAGDRRAGRPSCARAWPRSSRCCARTRTG